MPENYNAAEIMKIWYTSGGIIVTADAVPLVLKTLSANGIRQAVLTNVGNDSWSVAKMY